MDILIAHPYKHHAFHLAVGCKESGANVCLATAFYKKGPGYILSKFPGNAGKRAKSYFNEFLESREIYSPFSWQLNRFVYSSRPETVFLNYFDSEVAKKIASKKWSPKLIVTLQDYMPVTVSEAKKRGIKILSDQIINQSESAMSRISQHYSSIGVDIKLFHDESVNNDVLAVADVVTAPSCYVKKDLVGRLKSGCECSLIPYGVDTGAFFYSDQHLINKEIIIVVRANSVRKGGHLFLLALKKSAIYLKKIAKGKKIKFIVLGQFETSLKKISEQLNLPEGVECVANNYPYAEVPELMKKAHFFIMPSLSEGMSLACCEAMQAGLPLMVTPFIGIDKFKNGVMGVEVLDTVESVSDGLIDIFKKIDVWSEWGKKSLMAIENSGWDVYKKNISSLVERIAFNDI
jgi:glycosyltransferase involved in cell wall biosynthesis